MLRGALASLYDLATDARFTYEVVVIDNGSSDHTPQVIAEAAAASRHPLRGVLEPNKGIVPARNRGIQEARGLWIAFFDDDQLADVCWLRELFAGARQRNCRVVGGAVHLSFPDGRDRNLDPAVRMLLGEAKFCQEPRPYGGRLSPGCGNLMVERSVFEQVGVFERTISGRGEDTDLFSRIERAGIAAWYFPAAIVHHLTPAERLEAAYLLNLARRMGEGVALRHESQMSKPRLAMLMAAKAARAAVLQLPLASLARVYGDHETWLGRRCLLEINRSVLRKGLEILSKPRPTAAQCQPSVVTTSAVSFHSPSHT
jgi:glycosyltransferase involved in cell wall biosynthesis